MTVEAAEGRSFGQPTNSQQRPSHGHGHPGSVSTSSGFSPLARSAMTTNRNAGSHRHPSRTNNTPFGNQNTWGFGNVSQIFGGTQLPTGPAAMRRPGSAYQPQGTVTYSNSSVQWNANPSSDPRRAAAQRLVQSGLQNKWSYR